MLEVKSSQDNSVQYKCQNQQWQHHNTKLQLPASLPSQISHFHQLPTVIRRAFLRRILTKYQILSIGKVVFQNFMIGFEFKIKLNYWRSRKTPLKAPSRPIFAVERSQNFTAGNKMSIKLIINPVKRWPQKEDWFVSQFKPVSMTIWPMTMTKQHKHSDSGWGWGWKNVGGFYIFKYSNKIPLFERKWFP